MRAPPPVAIELGRSGVWRAGVAALVLATLSVLVMWAVLSSMPGLVRAGVVALGLVLAFLALLGARRRESELRWTGARWQLTARSEAGDVGCDGNVRVMIDLGPWMLLRFTPNDVRRRVGSWLPVQRSGLESRWHGLRCAVYAPPAKDDAS